MSLQGIGLGGTTSFSFNKTSKQPSLSAIVMFIHAFLIMGKNVPIMISPQRTSVFRPSSSLAGALLHKHTIT